MEQKFKFGDVVQISGEDSLKTKLYVVIDPEPDHESDIGVMSELLEPMFFMQENLELREDKIALAPALWKTENPQEKYYNITGSLFSSAKEAIPYELDPIYSKTYRKLIRWPATPTSFVIVDRENKENK